jgi:hypothetical protein
MAIPCVEFVNETALYFGEPSCAFDFTESLLPRLINRLSRLKDVSSLMAFANTFGNEQICFSRDEYSRGFPPISPKIGEVTDFPTQCTVLISARTNNIVKIITIEYVFNLSDLYEYRIEKALDLLNRELEPNYDAIAKRARLIHTTLSRRFKGVTISKTEVNSKHQQCLIII